MGPAQQPHGLSRRFTRRIRRANLHQRREQLGVALGHDVSHTSAHVLGMKLEQKQEQVVTPQREIAQKQEQSFDFGLGL